MVKVIDTNGGSSGRGIPGLDSSVLERAELERVELESREPRLSAVDLVALFGAVVASVVLTWCFVGTIRLSLFGATSNADTTKQVLASLWMLLLVPWTWGTTFVTARVMMLPVRRTAARIAALLCISLPVLLYAVAGRSGNGPTLDDFGVPNVVEMIKETEHRELMVLALSPMALSAALLLSLPSVAPSQQHRRVVMLGLAAEVVSCVTIAVFAENWRAWFSRAAAIAAAMVLVAIAVEIVKTTRSASPRLPRLLHLGELVLIPAAVLVGAGVAFNSAFHGIDDTVGYIGYLIAVMPVAAVVMFVHDHLVAGGWRYLTDLSDAAASPELVQSVLRRATGDSGLRVLFLGPDVGPMSLIDVEGRPAGDEECEESTVQWVQFGDQPVAAVVWGEPADRPPDGASILVGVAAMALDRARLHALLKTQIREVQVSRARLLEAFDQARAAIERDLHDGAQQSLLALRMEIGEVESQVSHPEVKRLARCAIAGLDRSIQQICDLARGVYPAALAEHGLLAAIESLVDSGPPITTMDIDPGLSRFTAAVEVTAYFVVLEAVSNALKHANATNIEIRVVETKEWLVVEVHDNGSGGAAFGGGTGLVGLLERVRTAGGYLTVDSFLESGTMIRAVLPALPAEVIDLTTERHLRAVRPGLTVSSPGTEADR